MAVKQIESYKKTNTFSENSSSSVKAVSNIDFNALENLDKEGLLKMVKTMMGGGIVLNFHGKRSAQEIDKKVRPRQTRGHTIDSCG